MHTTRADEPTPDFVNVYGHDLTEDHVSRGTVADLVFLGGRGRLPNPAESMMFNAVMIGFALHEESAARSRRATRAARPSGSIIDGVDNMEMTARLLERAVADAMVGQSDEDDTMGIIDAYDMPRHLYSWTNDPICEQDCGPHPVRFVQLAWELGFLGQHSRLLQSLHAEVEHRRGAASVVSPAATFCGLLLDLGFTSRLVRPVVAAARALRRIGQLAHEAGSQSGATSSLGAATRPVPSRTFLTPKQLT